jgi:sugar phosphate isomerase/epimerase
MKLGCSTWGMPHVPVDAALAGIAEIGYSAVELTVIPGYTTALERLDADERRRIRNLLARHGLDLPAIAGHTSLLAADPDAVRAGMARLKATADLAVDLAVGQTPPALNTTTGGPPDRWEELQDRLLERVGELVLHAKGRGVVVAIEPHVGAALDRPERVLWLLREIDSPWLRVNLDFSHFEAAGLPMEECVSALAPYTVHTHVKDVRGRAPAHEFLIPGEGGFDYPGFLRALRDGGYDGAITVEISVMVQRRPEYDAFAAVRQAYAVLAPALAEVTRRASPG